LIKKFLAFAVDKAILNHILFILMLIMAIFAYKSIPKDLFPPSALDKISIRGGYPGASADILDKMAVKPIEDDLKSLESIEDITTQIRNGLFSITLDIKEGANLQLALNDVKDIITNAKKDLPSDMDEPIAKTMVYKFPLLLIAISSKRNTSKEKLLEAAKKLKSRLSTFKDLGSIDIRGDSDYQVKIDLKNEKIDAYELNRQQLYRAISNLSSIFPVGTIKHENNKIYLSTANGEKSITALKNTILIIGNKRVKLGDIANVNYGLTTPNEISTFNGKENISLNITKTKNGNAIALSKKIREILKEFKKEYKNIDFQVYTDTSLWIRNRINLVTSNILFGLILVFISILLSVNWKISAVVAMGIPTSFFIGLIAANELGYSINMLTMLGALLALGMLVDEAIVVAENIYRHLEMGKSPRQAAIDGASEMFPAVLTATATTIFAFLPLLIMSGKIGIFIKVLPVMISILLLSSLFEAFYFLPLHSKELFSIGKIAKEHKISSFWKNLYRVYKAFLLSLLKIKDIATMFLVIGIIFATVAIKKSSDFKLFPKFDAEQIYLSGQVDVNNKLEETKKLIAPLEKQLLKDLDNSNINSITAIVGIKFKPDKSFVNGEHLFHIFINLKERKPQNFFDKYINPYLSLEYDDSQMQRDKSAYEIYKIVQKSLKKIKKLKDKKGNYIYRDLSLYVPQTGIVSNDIEIAIIQKPSQNIDRVVKTLKERLKSIKGVKAIATNKIEGPKELKLKVNRYGEKLGFSERYLVDTLRGLFLNAEYGKMLGDIGIIRVRIEDKSKNKNYDIKNLQIYTPNGKELVRLKDIADFIYIQNPLVLYKDSAKRVWSITAQTIKGKTTASKVMEQLKSTIKKFKKEGYEFMIKGEDEANRQVILEMSKAAIIAIFLIFISLVLMFNSLVLPLLTISVIPLSIVGALAGAKIMGINLTMPGMMGIVGLAGVVINDAIIVLDFIRGSKNIEEITQKASQRLRPIILTSITTILGLSSLIFFASGQALIIQPMAISLGFGVAWATILNLIYIPLIYAIVYRVKV